MSALWNRNISMIHCFGDSLTEGYGVLPGQGWVALANQGLKGISLYNHGVCGSLCGDILDSLSAASGRVRKDEGFFFMGGTNDILFGIRLAVLENRVEKELGRLSERIPLTLGIPPLFTVMSVETGWQEAGSLREIKGIFWITRNSSVPWLKTWGYGLWISPKPSRRRKMVYRRYSSQ